MLIHVFQELSAHQLTKGRSIRQVSNADEHFLFPAQDNLRPLALTVENFHVVGIPLHIYAIFLSDLVHNILAQHLRQLVAIDS